MVDCFRIADYPLASGISGTTNGRIRFARDMHPHFRQVALQIVFTCLSICSYSACDSVRRVKSFI